MATTQLEIPQTNSIVFKFENIWTPEGTLRITLWRSLLDAEYRVDLPGGTVVKQTATFPNVEFSLATKLLTKLPVIEKETENFFTEAHTNGFDLGLYNTREYDDVLGIAEWPKTADPFTLDEDYTTGRFIFRYLKPSETTELYGMVEFKADGESDYTIMEIGQAQNAIGGTDYRWYHGVDSEQLLDGRNNAPLDAEQIYDFRFVHVASSALDKVPAQPSIRTDGNIYAPNDTGHVTPIGKSYYMPFWDSDQDNPGGTTDAALPYPEYGGVPVVQTAMQQYGIGGTRYFGVWRRHIHAYEWLRRLLDYAYGAGNWVFSCDVSPLTFALAELHNLKTVPGVGAGVAVNADGTDFTLLSFDQSTACAPQIAPYTVRSILGPLPDVWLPQCLWGLYDNLTTNRGVPKLSDTFPKRYTSSWQVLVELCYHFGWMPLVHTRQDGKAEIELHDRTKPKTAKFTCVLPTSAKPTAFSESEDGIAIQRIKSFQNATTADGEWDDWYSAHNGVSDSEFDPNAIGSLVNPRQPNPYVIPSTAQKPAKLTTSLTLGADNKGYKISLFGGATNNIGWYSMNYQGSLEYDVVDTEAFPMLSPLGAVFDIDLISQLYDGGTVKVALMPFVLGRFTATLSDGAEVIVTGSSWRQLLARFYALQFVKSDFKYECEYPTINQFYALDDNGDVTGNPSWKNIDLYFQSYKPDGELYYAKRIVQDFNTMKTSTEELRIVSPALEFEGANDTLDFQDHTELTGNNPGPPPDNSTGGSEPTRK